MKIESTDIVTLPNAISAAGFALAVNGSRKLDTPGGLAETTAGRLLDLADGAAARATGQSSEFGAAVDATLDKLAVLSIGVNAWRKHIVPRPALVAMATQNALNAAATFWAAKKHPNQEYTPTTDGKYAMAAQNTALGAYGLANIFCEKGHDRLADTLRGIGHVATAIGIGYYGRKATATYVGRALKPQENAK